MKLMNHWQVSCLVLR